MSEIRIKSLTLGLVQTNCYMVYDEETKRAAIIDPGDCADQIIAYCENLELKPEFAFLIMFSIGLLYPAIMTE